MGRYAPALLRYMDKKKPARYGATVYKHLKGIQNGMTKRVPPTRQPFLALLKEIADWVYLDEQRKKHAAVAEKKKQQ